MKHKHSMLFWIKKSSRLGGALLCLFSGGCNAVVDAGREIRPAAAAGSFYPAQARELEAMLQKAFQNAPAPALQGELVALILPHAGYIYSGVIAAMGMRASENMEVETIYVVGTAHYANVSGALSWLGGGFQTPLGIYPVDTAAVRQLLEQSPVIRLLPRAWAQEHSVEVQVPFLQRALPKAKMVPLIMGTAAWEECAETAKALANQARQRKSLLIASTDFSHYPSAADARAIDNAMLEPILAMDPRGLEKADQAFMSKGIPELACTICGISAVKTVIMAAGLLGANQGQLICYTNSGEVSGETSRAVGYAAVALVKNPKKPRPMLALAHEPVGSDLNRPQQQELLCTARAAIVEALATGRLMQPTTADAALMEFRPVFVTLKYRGQLRGCIGMTEPRLSLYQGVAQMACAAAFDDPRFPKVKTTELPDIHIEISVLSPLTRIHSADQIVMGTHGVVVRRGERSGLFLPQVAEETGWSREEFLNQLCSQKAGLPADSWRDQKTELYTFTVQSFHE